MVTVIASVVVLGIIGLTFGTVLAFSSRIFAVEVDPRLEEIEDILPGVNCGGCSAAGCHAYAEAVVQSKLSITACAPGGPDVSNKIGSILGQETGEVEEMKAVVLCKGGLKEAKKKFLYDGLPDCNAAHLLSGGGKLCAYGCLGHGDCVKACTFNAMYMDVNELPVVVEELCTGCTLCVSACPRDIMAMIPKKQKIFIGCVNPEKGKAVKDVCDVGCTGCTLCANPKTTPSGDYVMEGDLPVINFQDNKNLIAGAFRCASESIVHEISFPVIQYDMEKCNGCEDKPKPLCVKICPVKNCLTFDKENQKALLNKDLCIGCDLCVSECPVNAFTPFVERSEVKNEIIE